MPKYDNRNAATVEISPEKSNIVLHKFQETAMKKMSEINKKDEFNGLLVLPTGAGKTMTATYWLLKNATDKGKKVLWIAHRHLLLDQAAETFVINSDKKASDGSDFLTSRISYKYRIISGKHDKPKDIQGDEDILICGKDSIVKNLAVLDKWMDRSDLFLVIDEAHHSVARTYRKIIDEVKSDACNRVW
ncbi:MAG: DEAD/DEAH box helicase family protein [Roseburia sp.]|nr:DEAD/DEAH box helicase family protein [Roseburia sp.]